MHNLITSAPEFTVVKQPEPRITIAVCTKQYTTVSAYQDPVCVTCGWIDGCVDDENGSVSTVWLETLAGWLCRSCVNSAVSKYAGWVKALSSRANGDPLPTYGTQEVSDEVEF